MKSVTLNIQLKDLYIEKQQELQEMLQALCQGTELEPDDDAFELYVDVTFYEDGSQYVR